jgi:hypothetical protein
MGMNAKSLILRALTFLIIKQLITVKTIAIKKSTAIINNNNKPLSIPFPAASPPGVRRMLNAVK